MNKWEDKKLPEFGDAVELDERCEELIIGYNKKSIRWRWYRFLSFITFGKFKLPEYVVYFDSLLVKTNGKVILNTTVTITASITFASPVITYQSGTLIVPGVWYRVLWFKIKSFFK